MFGTITVVSDRFPKVEGRLKGYSPEQVDEFLTQARAEYDTGEVDKQTVQRIRTTGFEMVKNGYAPKQVDEAIDRIEDAFAQLFRDREIAQIGSQNWIGEARSRAQQIVARLRRPLGEQFTRTNLLGVGYSITEVDDFGTKIIDHFTKNSPLSVEELRGVVFERKTRGYDEAQVDALIDATIDVMQSVE